jgi:hypothetical protein
MYILRQVMHGLATQAQTPSLPSASGCMGTLPPFHSFMAEL